MFSTFFFFLTFYNNITILGDYFIQLLCQVTAVLNIGSNKNFATEILFLLKTGSHSCLYSKHAVHNAPPRCVA